MSRHCPCGCGEMVKIGEDRCERLDIVPARLRLAARGGEVKGRRPPRLAHRDPRSGRRRPPEQLPQTPPTLELRQLVKLTNPVVRSQRLRCRLGVDFSL